MLVKGLSTHSGPSSGRVPGCCFLGCGSGGTGLDGPLDRTGGDPEGALYVDFLLLLGVCDGPSRGEGAGLESVRPRLIRAANPDPG